MSKHLAAATSATLHQEAYAAGAIHSSSGVPAPDFSDDWSIQREYENGFHGRPYWY